MAEYIEREALLGKLRERDLCLCVTEFDIKDAPAADVAQVVRCKDCRWAKPYERIDGKTGYYCHFCGNSFKYGTIFESVFTPVKEEHDFCSYGERRTDG